MRVYMVYTLAGVGLINGRRVWASGNTPQELLADCKRAFLRYKKHRESRVKAEPGSVFTVESAQFIPTGKAGQGAFYHKTPRVQVFDAPISPRAIFAHLDPVNCAPAVRDFMKRLGLRWKPIWAYANVSLTSEHLNVSQINYYHGDTVLCTYGLPWFHEPSTIEKLLSKELKFTA